MFGQEKQHGGDNVKECKTMCVLEYITYARA